MKRFLSTLVLLTCITLSASAATQGPVTASLSDQMTITLPADQPLAAEYVVDITGKFVSEAVLQQFCESFQDMGVTYRGDFAAGKLYITPTPLTDSTGKTWDAARWNDYFQARAPKMQMYMQTMNK